jgi:hypothetical protein
MIGDAPRPSRCVAAPVRNEDASHGLEPTPCSPAVLDVVV